MFEQFFPATSFIAAALFVSVSVPCQGAAQDASAKSHASSDAEADAAAKRAAAREKEEEAKLAAFLRTVEAARKPSPAMRVLMSFQSGIPDPKGGAKALTTKALLRLEALEEDAAGSSKRWSRLDVDLSTPLGVMRTEKVRTPDGIRIHQSSEMTGEKWYHVDRDTMLRLDKAARVFGSSGALPVQNGTSPSAVVGADLVRGLSRSYRMRLGKDSMIDGEMCTSVAGKLRDTSGAPQLDLPRERPDEVQLFFSKKSKLLRRMLQLRGGALQSRVDVRDVAFTDSIPKSRFTLAAPRGTRFVSIFDEALGSLKIRKDLQRLDAWEREQKARGDNKAPSENDSGKKAPESGATRK